MKQDAYAMTLLFDYYGELLTEKQKTCFDLYYNQDLSLSEIAEEAGITRQGVHDTLARAESVLRDCAGEMLPRRIFILHNLTRSRSVLQAPCDHDGENFDGVPDTAEHTAVFRISADASLRFADGLHLRLEFRNKAQRHRKNERQRRNDAPEQVDELVRGHDLVVAGKPQYNACQHDGRSRAVEHGFERQRVAARQIG